MARPSEEKSRGPFWLGYLGVLNGLIGDLLEEKKSPLSIQMGFYVDDEPLAIDNEKLAGTVGRKICVLAHGSCNTERDWRFKDDPSKDYGSLLKKDLGYAPFYLRYNTGLHIFANGQRLSDLLEELIRRCPQDVKEVVLIGHSMGGLVYRSACHYAIMQKRRWVRLVKKIFYLGTPHLGTHFEKFGKLTTTLLYRIPSLPTKAIALLIDLRSAGIKDMRHGYLTPEEWKLEKADDPFYVHEKRIPLLPTAEHYSICSTILNFLNPMFTHWFGDGMVHPESGIGRSLLTVSRIPADRYHFKIIPGIYHYNLPRDMRIYRQIRKACRGKSRFEPYRQSSIGKSPTQESCFP